MIYRFGHCLLDLRRAALTYKGAAIPVEPQVFDLLVLLVQQHDRVVSRDEIIETVWKGRIVSDAALNSRISAARKAIGDDGENQTMLQTVRGRGFRFIAPVEILAGRDDGRTTPATGLRQEVIRYCRTEDDVALAYSVSGDGPPIVKAANWLSHLDFDLESPIWQHVMRHLGEGRRLIRYDQRGCGLSDWTPPVIDFAGFGRDLRAIVGAATDGGAFDLVGISHGCAVAAEFTAAHPGLVRRLVLIGGMARGWRRRAPEEVPQRELLVQLARDGWGLETHAFRQAFTSLMFPDASPEQARWFNDLQRRSASAETAARILDSLGDYDVRPQLSLVRCPTLVLHSVDDTLIPFTLGRELAAGIPGAQFVSLPSRNHLVLESEPAWSMMRAEIEAFLAAS